MTKIKICGITNKEDALQAIDLRVDALGFVFADSPRRVSPEVAREIIELLPPFICRVGIFVNEDKKKVKEIARGCNLTTLQFHGEESPSYCGDLEKRWLKLFVLKTKAY